MKLKKEQGESTLQAGNNETIMFMKKNKIPVTRQNYLDLVYGGNPPEELGAEELLDIPDFNKTLDESINEAINNNGNI